MTTPKLYYIKSPLTNIKSLDESVMATITDEQLQTYRSEFDMYLKCQREAVRDGSELVNQCRKIISTLFQEPDESECKQAKYFERMIRNGELVVDKHSNRYVHPTRVEAMVKEARTKYQEAQSTRITIGDDSTLSEINNAVAFLLDKGYVLNTDFTVANSVAVAKTYVREEIQSIDDGEWKSFAYNLTNKGETSSSFSTRATSGYYRKGCFFRTASHQSGIECYKFTVSFQDGPIPNIIVQ